MGTNSSNIPARSPGYAPKALYSLGPSLALAPLGRSACKNRFVRFFSLALAGLLAFSPASAQQIPGTGQGNSYADQMIIDRGANTQTGNQQGNFDNGVDGGNKSKALAGDLFAIAVGLIAAGVAANAASPPCHCAGIPLIAAGIFFNQGGQGASGAGDQMYNMAGISDAYRGQLNGANDLLAQNSKLNQAQSATGPDKNGAITLGNEGGFRADNSTDVDRMRNGFQVDEASLRAGKLGEAFDSIEKNLGIDRKEFAQAMLNGEDVSGFLARKNALFGKSAEEFQAELAAQKLDPSELKEKLENGEYDDYKNAVAYSKDGDVIDNKGPGDPKQTGGASLAGKDGKTYDQLMAELFGKKGEATLKELLEEGKIVSDALKKDGELRALASNSKYQLSRDYVMDGLYSEKTLFERVNRVYKQKSGTMLPEDFYIRLQAERDMQRFR